MSGAGNAPARCFTLPVSGVSVTLAPFTGAEEILIAEASPADPALALALARRLGLTAPATDWAALTPTDTDHFLLRLRESVLGGQISASRNCGTPGCGTKVEFSFRIANYLAYHAPRRPRGRFWEAVPAAEPGWYLLQVAGQAPALFRLPSLSDQLAAYGRKDGVAWLARLCVSPEDLPARIRTKLDSAMECLAPPLAGTLTGACPECGAALEAQFEARQFCLTELKDRARFVYDDVDALAERYHWGEKIILALPQARRMQYAERARQAARAA